jgi:hypothetical protein
VAQAMVLAKLRFQFLEPQLQLALIRLKWDQEQSQEVGQASPYHVLS